MALKFPEDLAGLPQWVCWRMEPAKDGGRDTKVPYNPKTGKKAASNNPATWTTLAQAKAALKKYSYTGLGFMFAKDGGIVGIDIDHCRDAATGELNDAARAIVGRVTTYTEISPSGTGLHLFVHGQLPEGGSKNSKTGVEMYAHSRYFTMTGDRLPNTPNVIATDDLALAWIHKTFVKPPREKKDKTQGGKKTAAVLSDEKVLEKALTTAGGAGFRELWEGRWADAYASQSEADMALCCKLAFWTNRSAEQIDRLFRASALMRDKWDRVHHADGATYGAETIEKAIENTSNAYDPQGALPVMELEGRYFRQKKDVLVPITNFIIRPVEMLIADDATQLTADFMNVRGETFRLSLAGTDMNSVVKLRGVLNKRTIAFSFTGSDGDLEMLKDYISTLDWPRRYGVRALGIYQHEKQFVFVSAAGAFDKAGEPVQNILQLEDGKIINSTIAATRPIAAAQLEALGPLLLGYNEPAKTVAVLAWCAACFIKEHLKLASVKFPHLYLIGESGSGKSTTLERFIYHIFGRDKVQAASQVTPFTVMKESASSNVIPQAIDEFKPGTLHQSLLNTLYNHMRQAYDGQEGVRGRADQSIVVYELLAPLIVVGEESPNEAAVRDRGIELLFSRKDLHVPEHRAAFLSLCELQDALGSFGRGLLDVALSLTVKEVQAWHSAELGRFAGEFPARIANNLAVCMAGLRLISRLCAARGLEWERVFPLSVDTSARHLRYAAQEYLLDGGNSNKSIVEQTLEIMARMGLVRNEDFKVLSDGKEIAFRFQDFYDKYTKYRRDHAIVGECLGYQQFRKQLKSSDLYVDYKPVRFENGVAKAVVCHFVTLRTRCDVAGFEDEEIPPL